MQTYTTVNGDRLDQVCQAIYGRQAGAVEQVLAANPGLASHGPILPQGVIIHLPSLTAPEAQDADNIWR